MTTFMPPVAVTMTVAITVRAPVINRLRRDIDRRGPHELRALLVINRRRLRVHRLRLNVDRLRLNVNRLGLHINWLRLVNRAYIADVHHRAGSAHAH